MIGLGMSGTARQVLKKGLAKLHRLLERSHAWDDMHRLEQDGRVAVGAASYGSPRVWDFGGNYRDHIVIGKYCSIGEEVRIILGGEHPAGWVSTYPFRAAFNLPGKHVDGIPFSRGDVVLGNDVWIGNDAFLRSGIHVGDGAVIGACCVVTRNVKPYEIVGGNPCRTIRMRFSDEQIAALLEIRWWDWPEEEILANIEFLSSPDIEGFIRKFGKRDKIAPSRDCD